MSFYPKNDLNVALKLTPEVPAEEEKDKSKFITIELKSQAGARGSAALTYKKHIRTFENGTPAEFITLRLALEEVWRQNAVTSALDRENTVRMLILGESFTMYEAHKTGVLEAGGVLRRRS